MDANMYRNVSEKVKRETGLCGEVVCSPTIAATMPVTNRDAIQIILEL